MEEEKKSKKEKALLVGFYTHSTDKPVCNEHLEELRLLVQTFGIDNTEKVSSPLRKVDAATYMGSGKVKELVEYAHANEFDVIVIDNEISPAQQRNLEKVFKCPVMERSEIILGVFAQRAQTKEAKLQIQLAQAKYQRPRLKRLWTHLSRQRGGASYSKGEGEKQLEIDKRLLDKQIIKLEKQLQIVRKHRMTQRSKRLKTAVPTFAIIGYTNAGKSTLLRALTEADILVEDKLFATLDTSTKQFTMPNNQKILLIDTVGFIRKLPHTLIAAFKSTLEESLYTDILLHVVDASNPMAMEQAETTKEVLKELHADKKPTITVINKIDRCTQRASVGRLRMAMPHSVQVSALQKEGFEELFQIMTKFLEGTTKTLQLKIPQNDFKYYSEILQQGTVLEHEYEGNDIVVRATCPLELAARLQRFEVKDESN
ncbi:MAG: GTPase HflX [Chlamydiae bacterium]|nr:GTPase HflX [Chlamydiota bacterium]